MNKSAFILFFLLIFQFSFGQNQNDYEEVKESVISAYNSGNYTAIFDTYSMQMKEALGLEKTETFFKNLKNSAGNIIDSEFLTFNPPYTIYATEFDGGAFMFSLALSENKEITGFKFTPYGKTTNLTEADTMLDLPFEGEWYVVWGGDTKEDNYHVEHPAQTGAFDFLKINDDLKTHDGDGSRNEQYYAFGKEILSPAAGEVVMVVDGIYDNVPGEMNSDFVTGNTVVIKLKEGEYLWLAHFKKHSIQVKEGEQVEEGQLLGLCGNSGNSSEPHLHMHIQDELKMNSAKGLKSYFKRLKVDRKYIENYSPVRGDLIEKI
ncbi:peptidoglycan DD-metalloendopeptidase family protein [Zunongwangia pacifica]|uniref:Peptidoglycan DD-metalloendopeptidase family protein n=1 Tax=Zunongwangia pacifica TaxID=2911062 RepID=A0A9X1ZVM8_9FLAO|nr:peptidoglycan DD-metalloendopeptidase family protein [Zunongwangia pacifica]MCL6220030.1 peptidoglycan DD-metalloendopeptidase family protein [Zunongwangia pacifica]